MPTPKGIFNVTSSLFENFYRKRNPNQYSFTLQPVSQDFVYKEFSFLNITKNTGLDEIPARTKQKNNGKKFVADV